MHHEHLRRLLRVKVRHPCFFVTTCVAGRRPLLASPEAHQVLCEEWAGLRTRHGWLVGRYVVMPDHVHVFLRPESDLSRPLPVAVGKWKEWTSRRVRAQDSCSAFAWQSGFFDHLIRSSESMAEKWDYVRRNPVRAGLVTTPEAWPFAGAIDFE